MDWLGLLALKSKAEKLSLQTTPEEAIALLEPFGFTDIAVVEQVLKAARAVSDDPEATITEFVQGGGLAKLLAPNSAKVEDSAIECPHCNQVIFMTLT